MEKTSKSKNKKSLKIVQNDKWLAPYESTILARLTNFKTLKKSLETHYGSLATFASGHEKFGLNYDTKKQKWIYREWAPKAYALHLIGDFNNWNRESHSLQPKNGGVWEIEINETITHKSFYKVMVSASTGQIDRIPAYANRVVQNEETKEFVAQVWNPKKEFDWSGDDFSPKSVKYPLIYECHVGMANEEPRLGTYREFADNILPRIHRNGYTAIQMMAVQEHPYYGSFGYHVSSFFAPSSRFGTPEDLKYLIKKAHKLGIAVILDIVHSHAVKNILEGLNLFDGTDYQYFHGGAKGDHPDWDSKVFNYSKWEVLQFLLSNLKYWLEEFHFDGFRFDGVSSMMYHHHGHVSFDNYGKYFDGGANTDAISYLQLANTLIHQTKPDAISIAEDVSGYPGLCRSIKDGGLGFNFRLAMGLPDFWTKTLETQQDEDWNMGDLWGVLNNRREKEKTIAYAESHDQGLVGDKTIAFWLMDKEMYTGMMVKDQNLAVERGIALHKMIRLITITSGGEGYLNFMGNEFGHPEWIDFPREGNDWSYHYARRQWSLADNEDLKYKFLDSFDIAMVSLIKEHKVLKKSPSDLLNIDEKNKIIIFKRGKLIFIFNFNPINSVPDYQFTVPDKGEYEVILNSDEAKFGGHDRIDSSVAYKTSKDKTLQMYITNRTALILKKKS
jgi:1,4-alpha-glucan branching enzyme